MNDFSGPVAQILPFFHVFEARRPAKNALNVYVVPLISLRKCSGWT